MNLRTGAQNHKGVKHWLLGLFALVLLCFSACLSINSANAQGSNNTQESGNTQGSSSIPQFADTTNKTVGDYFRDVPLPAELSTTPVRGELRQFPLLYWRAWAAQPVPFLPTLIFLLFTSTIVYYIVPSVINGTKITAQTSFWRSLLTGLITCMVSIAMAQLCFSSKIGTPLANLILSLLELGVVIGYTTAALLIGETLLSLFGLKQTSDFINKQGTRIEIRHVCALLLGICVLALLLMIPGLSPTMPRIGARLVMLFALIGWGGFLRKYLLKVS